MRRDELKREPVLDSLYRLSRDGRSWIAAEVAYARAEVASDGRRILIVSALAVLIAAFTFTFVGFASAYVFLSLAPHVGGFANAAGLMALAFLICIFASGWVMWVQIRGELGLVSVLRRWREMILRGGKNA